MIVPIVGQTPGRRYGHTIVFSKPYLLVFAGNTGTEAVSDVWCLNVDKAPFSWSKLETKGDNPIVRVYHSAALCSTGSATGMMVIFGGRTSDQSALNDTWGLRRHRDGRWDWVRAPYKPNTEEPLARYQHSTIFVGTLMMVLGGRTNNVGENVQLEVYETESSEWKKFSTLQRFRHTVWALDHLIYMHGGFENETPNIPTNTIVKLDLSAIFKGNAVLLGKLEQVIGKKDTKLETGKLAGSTKDSDITTSGSKTPPLSAGEKSPKIRFDPVQIVEAPGQKPRTLKMDDFEEAKQAQLKKPGQAVTPQRSINSIDTLYSLFLNHLLRPREWSAQFDGNGYFAFRREHIIALAEECQKILEEQPMVLRVDAPIKVFGDIHGQY